jgi:hypothetical protein
VEARHGGPLELVAARPTTCWAPDAAESTPPDGSLARRSSAAHHRPPRPAAVRAPVLVEIRPAAAPAALNAGLRPSPWDPPFAVAAGVRSRSGPASGGGGAPPSRPTPSWRRGGLAIASLGAGVLADGAPSRGGRGTPRRRRGASSPPAICCSPLDQGPTRRPRLPAARGPARRRRPAVVPPRRRVRWRSCLPGSAQRAHAKWCSRSGTHRHVANGSRGAVGLFLGSWSACIWSLAARGGEGRQGRPGLPRRRAPGASAPLARAAPPPPSRRGRGSR